MTVGDTVPRPLPFTPSVRLRRTALPSRGSYDGAPRVRWRKTGRAAKGRPYEHGEALG